MNGRSLKERQVREKTSGGHIANHCPSPGTHEFCQKGKYHDFDAFRTSPLKLH